MEHSSEIIAVLSDIHGNTWALDAALEHARQSGATRIVTLGDHAYGPLDPRGTLERLMNLDLPAVQIRGNQDRLLWEAEGCATSLDFVRSKLEERHLDWLRGLPPESLFEGIFLCHGSPGNDSEYLLEVVTESGLQPRGMDSLTEKLKTVDQELVLCGHSHLPACLKTPDGRLIVNPGSVGLPAFTDDTPWPHQVENRSPHARYALIEHGKQGWNIALMAVPYDWEAAARMAEENHRTDWARALRSGWN